MRHAAMIPVASARMYSWSPTLTAAWRRLLEWVAQRSGGALKVLELADPYPLEELWAREDLGCVFMCGYPWAMRAERPHLLAVPVPSPPRYGGRPIYFTDFVVRDDSPYRTLEDTFGGCIAYSIEHSHSGYNAARFHLLAHRQADRPALYGKVLGPLHRQLPVIDAVLDGRADVGPVDAYGLDLLRRHGAERAKRVRVVATTLPAPSAPLVASPGVDAGTRGRLVEALLAAHTAPELTATLDELLIARFVPADPEAFDVMLERQRQAEAAGYARLA
jgi:ABC-type phosphate/phosphonate transport system substrate-binding protein